MNPYLPIDQQNIDNIKEDEVEVEPQEKNEPSTN
jgi:hypothetical protein